MSDFEKDLYSLEEEEEEEFTLEDCLENIFEEYVGCECEHEACGMSAPAVTFTCGACQTLEATLDRLKDTERLRKVMELFADERNWERDRCALEIKPWLIAQSALKIKQATD